MRYLLLVSIFLLVGCVSTRPIPDTGVDFELDRCTPFLNCVSSESILPIYKVAPIQLSEPLNSQSWDLIQQAALDQPGASLTETRFGYLRMTWHSAFFRFPDFVELLVSQDATGLNVRSQSLFGLFDFGVNRNRVKGLEQTLIELGLVVDREK